MHQAIKQEGNGTKTKENWATIFRAGNIFVRPVSLPSLGEEEILPSKTGKLTEG